MYYCFLIFSKTYQSNLIQSIFNSQRKVKQRKLQINFKVQNMNFHYQKQKTFRQLQTQNQLLFEKLSQANNIIKQLKQEINRLNQKIRSFEDAEQYVGPKLNYQKPSFFALGGKPNHSNISNKSASKSKSNKSIKLSKDFHQQLEIFTSQSDSQTQQYVHLPGHSSISVLSSALIHPIKKQKQNTQLSSCINRHTQQMYVHLNTPSKEFYGKNQCYIASQVQTPTARLSKGKPFIGNQALSRMMQEGRKVKINAHDDYGNDNDDYFQSCKSQILHKNPNSNNFYSMSHIDHKQNNEIEIQTGSAIKKQGKVFAPISKIFKKVTIAKPIYDCFFITGVDSSSNKPNINYYYPKKSSHFDAILALCYNEQVLRPLQMSSSVSQKKINSTSASMSTISLSNNNRETLAPNSNGGYKFKDFFVIPLRKQGKQEQKQYLVAYQVQQIIVTEKQKISCYFSRLYCFITCCKFFNVFKNLLNQFIQKTNSKRKQQISSNTLSQSHLHEIFQNQLQQPLLILSQKNADQNHTLNYRLDSYISIAIDIPSAQNSYKMISQFRTWNILNMNVQLKQPQGQEHINNIQTKLFGTILMYLICQTKIVLYSCTKSKISECILQTLQIIKPFQYVCPVLMTAMREEHEEYLSAPMSLLLGLWNDQHKRHTRQKIEIFMNRKQNLCGMIQKGKLQISEGIIINLDTGLIFGGGMKHSINSLALQLNNYYQNYCMHPKQIYKMFEKFISNNVQTNSLWKKIQKQIKNTQLYCYYRQKIENIQGKQLLF